MLTIQFQITLASVKVLNQSKNLKMPCRSKFILTSPERLTLAKFSKHIADIVCPRCGLQGMIKKNGRSGAQNRLTFRCQCLLNIGYRVMCGILKPFTTPSTGMHIGVLQTSPLLETPQESPSYAHVIETPSKAKDTVSVAKTPSTSGSNVPSMYLLMKRIDALEENYTNLQQNILSNAQSYSELSQQHKLLKEKLNMALELFHKAMENINNPYMALAKKLPQESFSPPLVLSPTIQPVMNGTKPFVETIQAKASTAIEIGQSSIPDTYAGRALSKAIHWVNDNNTKSHLRSKDVLDCPNTTLKSSYKPPENLPPVGSWTVLYFKNVPWTTLTAIRHTFRTLNFDISRIVNLAWRKGKVLEIIIDQKVSAAFVEFVGIQLDWDQTHFTIVSDEVSKSNALLFNRPPAHIAIMSFFAAIKRQAPTQQVAYFLKMHAISMLSNFSEAPFDQLWDAAGPLQDSSRYSKPASSNESI